MSSSRLSGRVVVVTGGSRGIGRATSLACAREGATVVAASRAPVRFPDEVSEGAVSEVPLDVRDAASVDAFFEWLDRTTGRVDLLVNSAGAFAFKPVTELFVHAWNDVIATNLTGVFLCSRAAFVRMKAARGGRIVVIGSIAGHVPFAEGAAYGASKFGVRGLCGVLTEEGKSHGVFATHVTLGAVKTDAWRGRIGFDPDDMLSPDDVAAAIVDVAASPAGVRIDEVRLMPTKGIL